MATPLAQRLRSEMLRKDTNARELASKAKVGASFVYDILNGKSKNPTIHKMAAIAEALGTTVVYLLYGDDHNKFSPEADNDLKAVPLIVAKYDDVYDKMRIESIVGGEVQYFNIPWIKTSLQADPDDLRVVHIFGDGMSPTLNEGDIVLIDIAKTSPTPSGMFAIFDEQSIIIKRLEFIKNQVRIISDNDRYSLYDLPLDDIKIVGRVVWFSRKV